MTSVLSSSITSASSAPNVHHSSCSTGNNNNNNLLTGVNSLQDDSLNPSSSYQLHCHQSHPHPSTQPTPGHSQQIHYLPQLQQQQQHHHHHHHHHHLLQQQQQHCHPHAVQQSTVTRQVGDFSSSSIHHPQHSHQILRHQYSGDSVVASSAALSTSVRKARLSATSSSPAAVVPVTCTSSSSSSSPPVTLSGAQGNFTYNTSIVDSNYTATGSTCNNRQSQVEQKIFRRTASRPDSTDGAEIEYYELQTTTPSSSNVATFNTIDTMNEMPNLYSQAAQQPQQVTTAQQFISTGSSNNNNNMLRQPNVTKIPIGGVNTPGIGVAVTSNTHYVPSSSSGSSVPMSSSPASSSSQPSSSSGPAAVSSSVIVIGSGQQHPPPPPLHHYSSYQNTIHQSTQLSHNSNVSRSVTCNIDDSTNDTHSGTSHRELPVDVPDSFVGVIKTAPRYPPPASMRSSSLNQTTNQSIHQSLPPPPPSVSSSMVTTSSTSTSTSISSTLVDIDRMRVSKYSDEVKIKRNDNIDDSSRSSLRESKKLMSLENHDNQSTHVNHKQNNISQAARINAAYEPDDDELVNTNKLLQDTHYISNVSLNDLESLVSRVSSQVTNGDLKNALEKWRLSKLLSVYSTVMNCKNQSKQVATLLASSNASTDLVQEIITMLQEDVSFYRSAFLIFSHFEWLPTSLSHVYSSI